MRLGSGQVICYQPNKSAMSDNRLNGGSMTVAILAVGAIEIPNEIGRLKSWHSYRTKCLVWYDRHRWPFSRTSIETASRNANPISAARARFLSMIELRLQLYSLSKVLANEKSHYICNAFSHCVGEVVAYVMSFSVVEAETFKWRTYLGCNTKTPKPHALTSVQGSPLIGGFSCQIGPVG